MEEWEFIEQILLKKGYMLYQTQFGIENEKEGFQANFINKSYEYKIKTFNKEIRNEIINSILHEENKKISKK